MALPACSLGPVGLGHTGLSVSPLGFGTGDIGATSEDRERTARTLDFLLDHGLNLIDTAACYGEAESWLGKHLLGRRDSVVFVSKCGHHKVLPDGSLRSKRISMVDIDRALRRLRTDRIEVMLLHSYDLAPLQQGDAIEVLQSAVRAGKIRYFGYSGDNERAAFAATIPGLSVLEISLSFCDLHNARAVLPLAGERKLGVLAKRPVASACWRRPESAPGDYVGRFRTLQPHLPAWFVKDLPAAALRFTLSIPGVHAAVVGARTPAHAENNLRAAVAEPLEPARRGEIFDVFDRLSSGGWSGVN